MALPEPLSRAIGLIKRFPGMGEKSARRMCFQLLQEGPDAISKLIAALQSLRDEMTVCTRCGNLTVAQPCSICSDAHRDHSLLCVVETLENLTAIENSGTYRGLYFNLAMGKNPLQNCDLIDRNTLARLTALVDEEPIEEIIIATNPRIEGDVTFYALAEVLKGKGVKISRPAYGLPVGGTIEFADRVTLSAAFSQRLAFDENGS